MKSCFAVSLSLSFFVIRIFSTELKPIYVGHNCSNTALFTPNSTYQSNLETLLSSLSTAAINSSNGFDSAAVGRSPPDRAYGLFLCRGDLSPRMCGDCVATGKVEILQKCPNQRVSVIWYAECMLRYSNQPIFSVMEREPYANASNTENVIDSTRFAQLLGEKLNDVATRASAGGSAKTVAVAQADFTNSKKLYTLAQCTPDLTASDCDTCLQFGISNLVQEKQGGKVVTPSCNVRYELYAFYYASLLPEPVPPPPAPITGRKGRLRSEMSLLPKRLRPLQLLPLMATMEIKDRDRGDLEAASLWIEELEKAFDVLGCTDEEKVTLAVYQLQGNANDWWKATRGRVFPVNTVQTWAMFVETFNVCPEDGGGSIGQSSEVLGWFEAGPSQPDDFSEFKG
ncbi:cysteine-rich receptor-like protein kinase 25 [Syzygium oleosum]|uniref:cysteine-rich receptor-like protein kinase 25 n=1 Tax=Syzygium oleosum TaxID=219896 RepID=UPI0024B89C0E|nr:cysteine-rich receptor-like protein kinase 25 [Syzygium oleosum]